MWWQGNAAYSHWVMIGAATYSCLEGSLNSAGIASNIAAQINASDPNCTATTGGASGNEILITLKPSVAGPVSVSSSDGSAADTLTQTTAASIIEAIAQQINAINWATNSSVALSAAVVMPNQLVVTAAPGADGNMIAFYQTDNTGGSRLYFTASAWNLSGGSSDNVSWHVHIDFTVLGWSNVDKVWWTIAPALPNSQAYQSTEWEMVVTNWTVTDTSRQPPAQSGRTGLSPHRGRQHLGEHVRLLGAGAGRGPGERRVRFLEPGACDPCGRDRGQRHDRDRTASPRTTSTSARVSIPPAES